ncbi:helix-turn-helix transcriptional regulator [Tissierella sp.]|uniref:helix-turn-helix domain-containing protein n=1 Tax=Tissierella sp. TaxID=41274 RepID=UPI00301F3BAB
MNNLGDRIKELRTEKKVSQTVLGKHIGVGKTTISNYETGYSMPDNETLTKIANFFNVSTDYLLGRTNIKNPADKISEVLEDDEELSMFWDEMKERPELKILFKQTRELSPKAIQQVIRIIKAIEDEEDRENN